MVKRVFDDTGEIKEENLNGIYAELANVIGVDATLKIHGVFRGQQLFLPIELYGKAYIRQCITAEYDGTNIRQLSLKYGYTEKWIRKIIKESRIQDD